jgi:hypothetical protein
MEHFKKNLETAFWRRVEAFKFYENKTGQEVKEIKKHCYKSYVPIFVS